MKSELKNVSSTQKEIHIQIDAEAVKAAYGRVSQRYAKRANVPGFRKGFAPIDVIRLRYKDEIKSDVLQEVIPSHVTDAIREHDLHPLTEPHLHLEDQDSVTVNGTVPLKLHVHFEVMPDVPVPNYKGVEITRRVKPVEPGEVDDMIYQRLQREAAFVPSEGRAAETGDTVIADFEGTVDGEPDAPPITAESVEIEIDGEGVEPAFSENLKGVKEDEEREFVVTYPEALPSPELAGKTVRYKAKVTSVGRQEVPELNDEWAKSLDEGYGSLDELKERLRTDLEKMAEADADARLRNNAIAKVIESNAFDVPNVLIENQARNLLNNFAQDLQQRGVDLNNVTDDFVQMAYSNMRQQAERDVRGAILLDKIAEAEGVAVSEEEIAEELTKLAEYYRTTADQIRETLEKQGGIDNIRNNLKTRKSIEAVVANAKVIDGPWVDESAKPAEEDAADGRSKKTAAKKTPVKKPVKAKKQE
ncbi:MAG: trigger factor [Acidobacteria bacterium]|nr:trigger factor [Acidobacteriota bacterium]MCW5949005.1 trigger factor [Pyrinomonadaceae bacterium]